MDLSYRLAAPGDPSSQTSGPASWGVSIILGLTGLLGIGASEVFDWGGISGALIGSLIVVGLASWPLPKLPRK